MADLTPARPLRVLIVDDDAMVRAGLTLMLDGVEKNGRSVAVVGAVGDGVEVPEAVSAHSPDVVLMDIRMPGVDGVTATRRLRRRPEAPEVIVLTTFDTDEHVLQALRAGAGGFLLKDTPPDQLVDAILRVAAGDPILSPQVTRKLIDRVAVEAGAFERARAALETLSPRERDIVLGVATGRTNAQIAAELFLSVATVKSHLTRVMVKLGLDNRTQVALLAHDAGLA
ncbi:response regulator transcription factor [Cryptosporangium aurantiacum]|uniref:Two component transcriptional regulator, LuxR family n=1 Tax=Cryptosporangium aurantiacum TaxID=134849 RepID=A0A1M7MCJ0_9ACTN|nr:response regulator transcription factor [Cryptosporangium aurantiacum]SHM88047.1 two component transcriptional regulator, LuxR family [Cryptosporangium aurantiacum]